MQLIPVNDTKGQKEFLQVAVELYKNDPKWIRPLDKDINQVFDKNKNKAFRSGEIERWILKDDEGKLIGRIAAFVNKKYKTKGDDVPVGGIGFFECINDQDAADLLLDNAKHWLIQHGMEAMDGPINFGERDRWWGMVTKGFEEPLYCMNYNPPYYVELFENYGFQVFFNQICFGMDPKSPLLKKIHDRHAVYASDPNFSSQHIKKDQLEKFAEDFVTVYNKAWAGHGGLKQMSKEQAVILFRQMKPVMDEKIIWFAYHKNEPIAMFVNLPDLNQWFKYLGGKFGLLQKLKFLWVKTFKPNKKFTGIVFGVVPEWHGKGIDAFIIGESATKHLQTDACTYTQYEMQWIGDFNPKMINIAESLGETYRSRNLTTYRYLFDRTKEFKRHPVL
ncbi:hypothetical protein LK994_02495 [Ferruginibacter lapsinanis]|uniref:hypothetical protein n=1 Tax=Ferruginibacter lapsinanis TaxID=563172 RepID=UPI001E3851FF|nr:hypothetical protein [Ferruginibacter lapsinanis]UEG50344.1 hypothetical protein LK994_02495 [Ferruginibacter lapsinanis]